MSLLPAGIPPAFLDGLLFQQPMISIGEAYREIIKTSQARATAKRIGWWPWN